MPSQAQIANLVYELLIDEAGAPNIPDMKQRFIDWFVDPDRRGMRTNEYRIGGRFGFGFKFWSEGNNRFWVNQYGEDTTEESTRKIEEINAGLDYLAQKMVEDNQRSEMMQNFTRPFAQMGVENIVFEGSNNQPDVIIPVRRLDDID